VRPALGLLVEARVVQQGRHLSGQRDQLAQVAFVKATFFARVGDQQHTRPPRAGGQRN